MQDKMSKMCLSPSFPPLACEAPWMEMELGGFLGLVWDELVLFGLSMFSFV